MSFWDSRPRLGTLPSDDENDSVSLVRFSSRTFSLGGVGGVGVTGFGNVVVVGAALLGRKIMLKPDPENVPVKCDRTPSGGGGGDGRRIGVISSIWNASGSKMWGRTMVSSVI